MLSDVVMPGGMSGFDVTAWVAAHKPSVKVILCSGYALGIQATTPKMVLMKQLFFRNPILGISSRKH